MPSVLLGRLTAALRSGLADYLELDTSAAEQKARQAVQVTDALRAELGAALVERRRLERQIKSANAEASLQDKAEAAISLGRDDLARAALMQKTELARERESVLARIDRLKTRADELEEILSNLSPSINDEALEQKLRELDELLADASKEELD